MVINNYIEGFQENKEDFLVNQFSVSCPRIFVRKYKSTINYNEKLVIPYYVTSYLDRQDKPYNATDYNYEDTFRTFTTIITINTEKGEEEQRVFKRTTLEGDFVIEIDGFTSDDVGIHNFTIKCIQNNGTTSIEHMCKFKVEDPNEQIIQINLDNIEDNGFNSNFGGTDDPTKENQYIYIHKSTTYRYKVEPKPPRGYSVLPDADIGKYDPIGSFFCGIQTPGTSLNNPSSWNLTSQEKEEVKSPSFDANGEFPTVAQIANYRRNLGENKSYLDSSLSGAGFFRHPIIKLKIAKNSSTKYGNGTNKYNAGVSGLKTIIADYNVTLQKQDNSVNNIKIKVGKQTQNGFVTDSSRHDSTRIIEVNDRAVYLDFLCKKGYVTATLDSSAESNENFCAKEKIQGTNEYTYYLFTDKINNYQKEALNNPNPEKYSILRDPKLLTYEQSFGQFDKGFIYITDSNYVTHYNNSVTFGKYLSYKGQQKIDIGGEYNLTTTCQLQNGQTVNLFDYITCAAEDVPTEVRLAAAKNKLAITRLCEAASAYGKGKKVELILPSNMNIVIDYHKLSDEGTIVPGKNNIDNKVYSGGTNIELPDNFILNMNNSSIYVLQTNDIGRGSIIGFSGNVDTHIKNGKIFGPYKYKTFSGSSGGTFYCELISNIYIYQSLFCSFENMEIAHAIGYDVSTSGNMSGTNGRWSDNPWNMAFSGIGYIDNKGNLIEKSLISSKIHGSEYYYTQKDFTNYNDISDYTTFETNPVNSRDGYTLTEDSENQINLLGIVPRFTRGVDVSNLSTEATLSAAEAKVSENIKSVFLPNTCLQHEKYSNMEELNHKLLERPGGFTCICNSGAMPGMSQLSYKPEMFIHFYQLMYEDDEKTIKFSDENRMYGISPCFKYLGYKKVKCLYPIDVPKGATHALISAVGSLIKDNKKDPTYSNLSGKILNTGDLYRDIYICNKYIAHSKNVPYIYSASWCCGFKNCKIHDQRTCILDNNLSEQCYIEDSYTWNLAAGRNVIAGGHSNQTYYIDLEDNTHMNKDFFMDNCENIYGLKGARIHHGYNLNITNCRNFNPIIEKGQYGLLLDGHYGNVTNSIGWSHSRNFRLLRNCVIDKFKQTFTKPVDIAVKHIGIQNSTITYIPENADSIHIKNTGNI